ncbi:MAG: UDP-N-acetylmuramoyl-L-alanyl-D-glutamate--2,6-diaminopimelate ligase [Halobacteriovoraceae bacterium]|nr:UDP-N-acetylmuramoyl-L-alanyl-D-glutamate--2,6-diaminopimelate ligase [Halobacteriovoraceae bacterium]
MNRDQLFKVLQNTIKEFSIPNDTRLDNVEWKAENSQKSSLLFYSVKKEDNSFWERIKKYPFGILVINNGDVYKKIAGKENVILIDDKNWLEAQKKVLDVFCPMPEKLKFIGVTGTNGKTSTLHYMTQILTQLQKKNLLISTIGVFKNLEKVKDFNLTTPSFIDLRKSIHQFSSDGCVVLCEVSSHALDQDRYYGIDFDYAGWTNFTQDHLDYHQTMESYFLSKAKILPKTKGRVYTSETEDSFIQTLLKEQKVWGVDESKWSSLFKENTIFSINFNARNLALSLTLLSELGVSVDKKMISQLKEVPGRSNILNTHDKMIVVDFAHTPDALKNICQSLKNNYSNHSLVVLFGCGGDRDPSKRPLMAKAVEAYADRVYLTSDNPRFEDPKKIMNETFHGFLNTSKVICEVDRKKAIETAIGNLQDNEILLVAGKGHEPYLDVKGVKIPYNDSEYIKAVLEKLDD